MQEIYRFIDDAIEADRQRYTDIADQIWDHPETRFEEFWSAEHLASALESAGFTVTRNVGNIPNAFIASFGQGKPVIALLGEYDALAGLSQQAGCAQPTSVTPGENGHGCGHNLLGTAAFAAAIAVKKWLEQYGQGGTVRFLSLIHISEPTRLGMISYAVFCLKKKKKKNSKKKKKSNSI